MVKKGLLSLLIGIFLVLVLSYQTSAVGIGTSGSFKKTINFEPFKKAEYDYLIRTYSTAPMDVTIHAKMAGGNVDLTPYVRIEPEFYEGATGIKPFEVFVDLPESIEQSGTHTIMIYVLEGKPKMEGTGMIARTEVGVPIKVNVLYPGIEIRADMHATNVNQGEESNISITMTNWGTTPLISAEADVSVFNENGRLVGSFTMGHKGIIQPWDVVTMYNMFDTDGLDAGNYYAKAKLKYYNESMDLEADFIIGTKNVEVINHTKRMYVNQINPFDIHVKSNWNAPIRDLNADVFILGDDAQTPNIHLKALGTGKLSTFFDTRGFAPATVPVEIILHYEGQKTIYHGTVELIEPPELERPGISFGKLDILIIIMLIIIILLLFNTIVILYWKKRKQRKR